MRYLLLALFTFLVGCEPPQIFDDKDPDMIRQTRNPPVARIPVAGIIQVVPTTPREGLWSGYNQLGYEAKYGPDQRQTQTILKLDEWGAPEVWTLSFFVKKNFKLYDGVYIKARINFGAGGSTQVVEIDWVNGTQISLPMNAVNVEAIFQDVDVTTEGAGLSVGVQLARGNRAGGLDPVLTIAENVTAGIAGATADFDIPLFAKSLYAIPCMATEAEIVGFYSSDVQLVTLAGNNLAVLTGSISGAQMSSGMELPVSGSMARVNVQNTLAFSIQTSIVARIAG